MIELEAPFMVDFEVTNRCPYRCIFCEGNLPNIQGVNELTTTKCFYIFEKLSKAGILGIFLTGGEPFDRPDIFDLIKFCFDVGLEPTISTNGFHLNEATIDRIPKTGLKHIQVSIHGYKDIHDSLVRVCGAYDIVLKNLIKLIESSIDVEIACVGLKENFESIPNLLNDLASIGIKKFRILRYMPAHTKEMLQHIPSIKVIMDTMPKITEIAKKNNITLFSSFCPGLVSDPRLIYESIHPMALTCPAGKSEFAILPNGDVYPCVNLKDNSSMYIGNILKDEVKEIWNHPTMIKLRKLTPKDYTGICGRCKKKYACYSARCIAFNLTGDIYGDDLSCYIVRKKLGFDVQ